MLIEIAFHGCSFELHRKFICTASTRPPAQIEIRNQSRHFRKQSQASEPTITSKAAAATTSTTTTTPRTTTAGLRGTKQRQQIFGHSSPRCSLREEVIQDKRIPSGADWSGRSPTTALTHQQNQVARNQSSKQASKQAKLAKQTSKQNRQANKHTLKKQTRPTDQPTNHPALSGLQARIAAQPRLCYRVEEYHGQFDNRGSGCPQEEAVPGTHGLRDLALENSEVPVPTIAIRAVARMFQSNCATTTRLGDG